jgi:hypothetical protein
MQQIVAHELYQPMTTQVHFVLRDTGFNCLVSLPLIYLRLTC